MTAQAKLAMGSGTKHAKRRQPISSGGSRWLLMLLSAVFAAVACSSSPLATESGPALAAEPSTSPDTASATPSTAPSLVPGASFTASDSIGDRIKTIVSFGPVQSIAGSDVDKSALASCGLDSGSLAARSVVVKMELYTVGISSMSDQVNFSFSGGSSDPNTVSGMEFVINYSTRPRCFAADDSNSGVQFSVSPSQSDTTDAWIIYPDVITPDRPRPSPKMLGTWMLSFPASAGSPAVSLSGPEVTIAHLAGSRVGKCRYSNGGEIVPVGSLKCA